MTVLGLDLQARDEESVSEASLESNISKVPSFNTVFISCGKNDAPSSERAPTAPHAATLVAPLLTAELEALAGGLPFVAEAQEMIEDAQRQAGEEAKEEAAGEAVRRVLAEARAEANREAHIFRQQLTLRMLGEVHTEEQSKRRRELEREASTAMDDVSPSAAPRTARALFTPDLSSDQPRVVAPQPMPLPPTPAEAAMVLALEAAARPPPEQPSLHQPSPNPKPPHPTLHAIPTPQPPAQPRLTTKLDWGGSWSAPSFAHPTTARAQLAQRLAQRQAVYANAKGAYRVTSPPPHRSAAGWPVAAAETAHLRVVRAHGRAMRRAGLRDVYTGVHAPSHTMHVSQRNGQRAQVLAASRQHAAQGIGAREVAAANSWKVCGEDVRSRTAPHDPAPGTGIVGSQQRVIEAVAQRAALEAAARGADGDQLAAIARAAARQATGSGLLRRMPLDWGGLWPDNIH